MFSGQAVSVLGDRMAVVALAFAVLEISEFSRRFSGDR